VGRKATDDEDEADSFEKVARLVGGRNPPPWLVKHFKTLGGKLGAPSLSRHATANTVGDRRASHGD
jgi:hypothetical protein